MTLDLSTVSDEQLVAWARKGNEDGFRGLVLRYRSMVFDFTNRLVRDSEVAEDLTQETFLKAVDRLHSYRGDGAFSSWIIAIANSIGVSYLRSVRVEHTALERSPSALTPGRVVGMGRPDTARSDSTTAAAQLQEVRAALQQAIDRLPHKERRCFELHYLDQRSYDDIAEFLNLPVATVKTRALRARNHVKDTLGPLWDERGHA
jgi:RNA polymerase sigma-70 factor (ECF subfamily)